MSLLKPLQCDTEPVTDFYNTVCVGNLRMPSKMDLTEFSIEYLFIPTYQSRNHTLYTGGLRLISKIGPPMVGEIVGISFL